MNLKKPFIMSVVLHLMFFAATMLFSAGFTGGSGLWPEDKTFFVHLEEDVAASKSELPAVQKKLPLAKKLPRAQKEKSPSQIQKNIVPIETTEVAGDSVVIDEAEDTAGDAEVVPYRVGEDSVVDIVYGQDIPINTVHRASLSEMSGLREANSRGMGNQGIMEKIRKSIERVKIYPMLARKRGIEGTVYIGFRITPQGKPRGIRIIKGSGFRILDQATMDIVERAAPFPPTDAPIEVPVVFTLN